MKFYHAFFILFIFSVLSKFSFCSSDEFQTTVDEFIGAFDDTYSTELNYQSIDEVNVGNEISSTLDTSTALEAPLSPNEDEQDPEPIHDEPVVTETVFLPGSDIRHELTEEVRALAEKALSSISSELRLVNVTEAFSMVTDKVQRSLRIVVTRKDCDSENCEISCRVELINRHNDDQVTWHNCLDSPNNNEVPRIKRGAIGGFKQVDEEEAKQLADIAVQTLDSIDADDNKRVVTQILKAQKQLVNGIMYHFTMEVGLTECKEDDEKCEGKINDYNICKVLMQRLFAAETPNNAQVIKSECSPISQAKEFDSKKSSPRTKRLATVDGSESNMISEEKSPGKKTYSPSSRLMGGKHAVDPESDKIREISEFALGQMDKSTNSLNKRKIVRIVDARSQVVAGIKYFLKMELIETNCRKDSNEENCSPAAGKVLESCEIVVWDKPWEKFRKISKASCTPVENRKKRDVPIPPGGLKPVSPDDSKIQEIAQFAVAQLDAGSNALNAQKLIAVKEAKTQVVAGVNYYLKLQLVESNCPKGSALDSKCEAASNKVVQECDVVVYERPWQKHREMTSAHCSPVSTNKKRSARDVPVPPGGLKPVSPDDSKIQEIAQFAVAQLDAGSNALNAQKLISVKEAKTQVVAGVNYYLKLQLVESNCPKGSALDSKCEAASNKVVQECDVVVYERPWQKHREMISADCSPVSTNKKRSARDVPVPPGGLKPVSPDDSKIQEIAQFAVAQLDAGSNALNAQKLITVKEAKTQVVAGVNYYLKLQLVESNCPKGSALDSKCEAASNKVVQECDVVVYERPWQKHREMISADCSPVSTNKKRSARDVPVPPGGLKPVSPDDSKIQEIAQFAVAQLDAGSNALNAQKLISVKEAKTQVVAGVNYYLKLQLVESNCPKGSALDSKCEAASNKVVQECDVVVYERPWQKHREMISADCSPVSTNKKRSARDVPVPPGGLKPVSPDDSKIQEIAQFAVAQLDAGSNALNAQKLITVKEAKTQVVAGVNYYLKLQLVESNCPKGSALDSKCEAASNKVVQECDVVVYERPWQKHREMTSADCSPVSTNKKRSARVVAGVNYYLKLQLVETTCRKGSQDLKECPPAKNKVIQECDVVVYERAWEKHRELTSAKCSNPSRHKRDVLVGGQTPHDIDAEDVQELAQFAVEDMNQKSNSGYKQTLVEVISAHTQVVSGLNYHLKLRVAQSNCEKSDSESANCSPKGSKECDVTIWSQPWLKKKQVTKSECKRSANERKAGEPQYIDPEAPEVQAAAKLSLKTIDQQSNAMFKHVLLRVTDANVQTVSGKKYYLTIEVGLSECRKRDDKEDCPLQASNAMSDKCNVVVWTQPWLNKTVVKSVSCGRREKRSTEKNIHLSMFEEFKTKYNKVYSDEIEHQKRFRIFRANLKKIQYLQENEQGTATYGPNMFADLSAAEFKKMYTGLKSGPVPKSSPHHMRPASYFDIDLPESYDWRDHGVVTPVKNQGSCGSCWAFSVTGNIEGQWALKHKELLSLSEQELVDCDKTDSGCNGGYMTQAYESIEKIGGLETEKDYPYDAKDETCKFNQTEVKATVVSSVNITTNETKIAQWLLTNGPISIGINANAMQFYMGGVSHPLKFLCSKDQLDHGVLLVGFGVHRTSIRHKLLPYWLIKNSWGPHWGEKGYYRVYRGDSTCGVNQMCSSAVVG